MHSNLPEEEHEPNACSSDGRLGYTFVVQPKRRDTVHLNPKAALCRVGWVQQEKEMFIVLLRTAATKQRRYRRDKGTETAYTGTMQCGLV